MVPINNNLSSKLLLLGMYEQSLTQNLNNE